jgi:hypothetical protein
MLTSLDEFIKNSLSTDYNTGWIIEEGFKSFYVRYRDYFMDNKTSKCLDLIKLEAINPGAGAFSNLFYKIREQYPDLNIYIENVFVEYFRKKLLRIGFEIMDNCSHPNSFIFIANP